MKINSLSIAFLVTFIINLSLGIFVYTKGKRKLSNKIYSIFTIQLSLWSFLAFLTASTTDVKIGEFLVRLIFAYAGFIPSLFYFFTISIGEENLPQKDLKVFFFFIFLSIANVFLAFSPDFIKECYIPTIANNIMSGPIVKYTRLKIGLYSLNIFIILMYSMVYLYRKKNKKQGITALEIHYVFLGILFGAIYNILLSLVLPTLFTDFPLTDRIGPFATVIMSSVIIYGIAKYKIMDVVLVYEAIFLYIILFFSLFLMYGISFKIITSFLSFFGIHPKNWPIFVSGFIVAVVYNPLKEKFRKVLRLKFLKYDIEMFTKKIFEVLFTFSNPKEIFENLVEVLSNFLNIPKDVLLLFKEKDEFPYTTENLPSCIKLTFDKDTIFWKEIEKSKIIIKEEEERMSKIYPEKEKIVEDFNKIGYDVVIGIIEKGHVKGLLFLKQKIDGSVFSYRDQLLLLNLGYQIGIAIENIKLYHEIISTNLYIKSLLDNSPFGVISFNEEGNVAFANKQIELFFEIKKENLIGKNYKKVLPVETIPLIEKKFENLNNEILSEEIILKKNNKNYVFREIVVPFIDEYNKKRGVITIFSDITEIKKLQEEIKEKEKFASLGVMAAGVAHEIKNPLVAIKTFIDLFPERYHDKEFRDVYSKLLQDEVRRINHLIEQILLFANPKPLKIEEINLIEMLKTTLILWRFQCQNKNIKIFENYPESNIIIKGDREKLKEVFFNILTNSYDAIENEKGVIVVSLEIKNDNAEICIEDNGKGIKKEIIDKIFDPFFTTKDKGTGLGLSIVTRIVEEHGGKVYVESEENKGTKVYIKFPIFKKEELKNEIFDGYK